MHREQGSKQLMDRLLVKEARHRILPQPDGDDGPCGQSYLCESSGIEGVGYESESEVLNRPAVEFWENSEEITECVKSVQAGGSNDCEMVAKRKDGTTFDAEVSREPDP